MATIPEILNDVRMELLPVEEAEVQIQAHIDAAVQAVDQRTRYAAAALQGHIGAGKVFPSREALADECLAIADAVQARAQG